MNTLRKIFTLILSLGLLSAPLPAQTFVPAWQKNAQKREAKLEIFDQAFGSFIMPRQPEQTAGRILARFEQTGRVNGCELATVLNDAAYIQTLGADEAADLAYAAAYAEAYENGCDKKLLHAVLPKLAGEYNEKDPDLTLKYFYAMTAGSLGRNPWLWRDIQSWAFGQAENAAHPLSAAKNAWGAAVLVDLASAVYTQEDGVFVMNEDERYRFEKKLEDTIRKFNWMKDIPTDYMLPGVKSSKAWSSTNQGVLISLFAQANSFFAYKESMVDPQAGLAKRTGQAAKMFVTTGGFNDLGRMVINGVNKDANAARFSDTGEVFYLHNPTPGTDGRGHFADSANGRRHRILGWLVQALTVSYFTRGARESSALTQRFVRSYLKTDDEGHFVSYLYIPLQGMRLGRVLLDKEFLEGWDREEAALQTELYKKLKSGYPWNTVCTSVQGACEVAAEWMAVGKVFGWVFKGLGWGVRGAAAKTADMLPTGALTRLAVVQVGARSALRWGREGMRALLRQYGWKAGAATAAAAAKTSDRRLSSVAR